MNEFEILETLLTEHIIMTDLNEGPVVAEKLEKVLEGEYPSNSKFDPSKLGAIVDSNIDNLRKTLSAQTATARKRFYTGTQKQKDNLMLDIKPKDHPIWKATGTTQDKVISTYKHGIPDQTQSIQSSQLMKKPILNTVKT